jgi:transcriptional regulator with XRE-family HTH domain
MSAPNVLRVNAVEERTAYRDAVSEIIRRVINERETTLIQIAEAIDVSLGTISNAFNKKADLCPTFLNRLGKVFGPHVLDPYVKLSGGRVIPLEISTERDILPLVAKVNLKIVEARDSASPGGARELLREKANYVPDLRELRKELDVLICQIETELAA